MKIGFDNDKYLKMQSSHIKERIAQFGDKLYLEFGGKLFDDYHASRVLPGFAPDSKLQMLLQLKDQAEVVIAISASDIERNKVRGDLGITYDNDVIRLIEVYREKGLYVGSVVITQYDGQKAADVFKTRLENMVGTIAVAFVIIGFAVNFIFGNYETSILQSVLDSVKDIVSMLLGVVNVFSDIVSYIRLWAVGLAGAAISATINDMVSPLLGHFVFIIFAVVVLVFGHGLNMILNVLSVIVHGIRLNTLEFSNHIGLSWSGHKYEPFEEKN